MATSQPTQFHGVPLEERAIDSKGNRLPWSLEYHEWVSHIAYILWKRCTNQHVEIIQMHVAKSGIQKRKALSANRRDAKALLEQERQLRRGKKTSLLRVLRKL